MRAGRIASLPVVGAGRFRRGGVGIYRGERLVHMAPPAHKVAQLTEELTNWLANTDLHPVIAGCMCHYELEFIHPFSDGNGRMGRLWRSLILYRWHPLFAYLPVETIIKERQQDYYAVLQHCDQQAESTAFTSFMLDALVTSLQENANHSDQVRKLLSLIASGARSAKQLRESLKLKQLTRF